ncbi:MAG: hypothetical protein ACX939_06325, partial [Hyphococcus sp.]
MKSLKSLSAVVLGAIVVSAAYAAVVKDNSIKISVDDDDGYSMRHLVNGDRGEFARRTETDELTARWRGDFALTPDGDNIRFVDDSLEIEWERDGATRRVEFDERRDALELTYSVDGDEQPEGPETDAAVAELVLAFLRVSGIQADERVAALLRKGGAETV